MIFKTTANALNRKPERLSSTKVKGRQQTMCRLTPFQGLGSRMYPFHRALPDANAKRLSALTTITGFLFSIPKPLSNYPIWFLKPT